MRSATSSGEPANTMPPRFATGTATNSPNEPSLQVCFAALDARTERSDLTLA